MKIPRLAPPRVEYLPFAGGLDTETPPWQVTPGMVRSAQNFEISINGGYATHAGYERFDGQPKPSDQEFRILEVNITGEFSVGETVTQLVSGATGKIIALDLAITPKRLILTRNTGVFNATDDLQVSSVTEGNSLSVALSNSGDALTDTQYTALAADEFRTDILVVPGSGSILGVWMISGISDVKYAFRANLGGTAVDMYKSSAAGWVQVALGFELSFTSGGTSDALDGQSLLGETSGATATITRVVLESGSFSAGTAAGRFIFASQTGTFQAEELTVNGVTLQATIAGDSTAITMATGGRFEFVNANFGGQLGTRRMYGADGVNRGFEFDGTIFVPIDTGITLDSPKHVVVHKNQLFFSYQSSAQHSGIGEPYIWDPIFGAAELATGDAITGFMPEPGAEGGATLGIYNRNTIHMLYGNDSSDWILVRYREEVGAFDYTIQQFGLTTFLDDRGLTNLQTVQAYGNFRHATVSSHIQKEINAKKLISSASCVVRDKSQYRIFFSDQTALYMNIDNNEVQGIMPQRLLNPVVCIFSLENVAGEEEIFYGSDNGFVYQMERGTCFDGFAIESFVYLHSYYSKSIRYKKKYYTGTLERKSDNYSELDFSYELGFNPSLIKDSKIIKSILDFNAAVWDSGVWDTGAWDGVDRTAPITHKLNGSAENIAFVLRVSADNFQPVTVSGIHIQYSIRRQLR